ncbi:uncharacterized protein LOC121737424 [Aricia agestis]|uniref:uncharacterized protein LOC121737424 n=1 Tax=Aricia agestis TaxID=91739 RepID=UPI001C207EEB|nr:uncharacterized protein LOC121737424 [Aricia agestis]
MVTKEKLKHLRNEFNLRNTERNLIEELAVIKNETGFMTELVEELLQQTSELQYQVEMIEICKASEETKIQNNIACLKEHKNGFDDYFAKEKEILRTQHQEQRNKEAEEEENERKKNAQVLEIDEQFKIEADCIEKECEEIEKECGVLTKRNRAIMLQLRRRLIESENTRRALLKQMKQESNVEE